MNLLSRFISFEHRPELFNSLGHAKTLRPLKALHDLLLGGLGELLLLLDDDVLRLGRSCLLEVHRLLVGAGLLTILGFPAGNANASLVMQELAVRPKLAVATGEELAPTDGYGSDWLLAIGSLLLGELLLLGRRMSSILGVHGDLLALFNGTSVRLLRHFGVLLDRIDCIVAVTHLLLGRKFGGIVDSWHFRSLNDAKFLLIQAGLKSTDEIGLETVGWESPLGQLLAELGYFELLDVGDGGHVCDCCLGRYMLFGGGWDCFGFALCRKRSDYGDVESVECNDKCGIALVSLPCSRSCTFDDVKVRHRRKNDLRSELT